MVTRLDFSPVLHVDDDQANRLLMAKLFARYRPDDELLSASCGRDAIALAQRNRPRLVLLDLSLPDISGEDVLRALKSESTVPVVVLSGHADEMTRRRLTDFGADGYLTKPFEIAELRAIVDSFGPSIQETAAEGM